MDKDKPLNEYRIETKQRILECAGKLFATNGIRGVNMEGLSKTLGISKRTIYELYTDKEALLLECIKSYHEKFHQHLTAFASEGHSTIEIINEFFSYQLRMTSTFSQKFIEDLKHYPNVQEFFENHSRLRDHIAADFFKRGVEEGFFRDDIDYELVVRVGTISLNAIMEKEVYKEFPLDSILLNVPLLYIRGLCTLKGLENLKQ